jgi:glycosyltransferase involved in cell wall biosynthesis
MKKLLISLSAFFLILACFIPNLYKYAHRNFIYPDVTVAGFIQMADGMGRQSVELIDVLKDDFDVHFMKTRFIHNLRDVPTRIHSILQDRKRPTGKVVIFEETLSEPEECFKKVFSTLRSNQIRLAYSMFETSKLPQEYVQKIEKYFDGVIVADAYNVKTYRDSGVTVPIFVLPLGLDLDMLMQAPLKSTRHTPFVFGNFSTCENRKNHLLLIRAFAKAFGNREDVLLKINARRGIEPETTLVKEEIEKLHLTNVLFTINAVDKAHYLENFESIDCYVNFSKGEGFSIQPREAMAMGIPCVLSDNTAQSTICHSNLIKSVPSTLAEKAIYESFTAPDYGDNFNTSLDDAAAALEEMFEHYEDYLQKAPQLREWVHQYEFKHLAPLYKSLVKPKKLVLGQQDLLTEECLVTTSETLYKKYLKLYPHLKNRASL